MQIKTIRDRQTRTLDIQNFPLLYFEQSLVNVSLEISMTSPHCVSVCCCLRMSWVLRHWYIFRVNYLKATKGNSESSAVSEPDLDVTVQTWHKVCFYTDVSPLFFFASDNFQALCHLKGHLLFLLVHFCIHLCGSVFLTDQLALKYLLFATAWSISQSWVCIVRHILLTSMFLLL